MARKKGRDIHGWLIVDKPAGMGSTEVVSRLRRVLDAKKAGHAGTLDPDATGLLAVAFGEATKTVPFVEEALKAYDFTVAWGAETGTDDASGEVLARSHARPERGAIEAALDQFRGDIMQVPPAVSAVKVGGARAYDLARAGEVVELAARPLHVAELTLLEAEGDTARLRMVCGKGGYVRAIARDLGRELGCLGHVAGLRRVWSGPFTLDAAVTPEMLERGDAAELEALIQPLESALAGLPQMRATEAGAVRIRNGNPGEVLDHTDYGAQVWASRGGRPLCVGRYFGGTVQPERVFNL
ncbi:tRNA pseudouridine(55) synthase TruB [Paracoccus sp. S-4012]|uniref:tRNA pseudouridine(55) synthase TruB n=1 Tax=Paracoccus sp. S-4012 TaxID=2665648 RepID=UPI0012AF178F|nr:tRNA pseudouridine(55) synthase TruB [Paracoccus sp. S-4012]MRX49322.1 tRNA pseudouridine(55) synthase TruB [Paracoccus sp. S-4012]